MKHHLAITSVSLATMLFAVDISIVNTALPAIQAAFHASYLDLRWIIDIFSIFLVSLLIPAGLIGDQLNENHVLYTGLALFFAGCLLAGIATNFKLLLIGRAVQGIAIASLFPASLAVMTHLFPANQKTKAIAIWSMASGIGLAIGPVLGGLIISFASWHWVFLFNLPLIILSALLGLMSLETPTAKTVTLQLRWHSVILFASSVAALITGVLEEPNWGYQSPWVAACIALGLVLFAVFYRIEYKQANPLIDFSLFKSATFSKASCITFNCGFLFYSLLYLAPLYLHDVLLHHGYELGLLMLPISVSLVISSRLLPWFTRFISLKNVLIIGLCLLIIGNLMQLHFSTQRMPLYISISFAIIGFAWGITYAGATSYALSVIPDKAIHTASSVFMTIRNFGGGLGLAITGTLFYHCRHSFTQHPIITILTQKQIEQFSFLHGFYAATILVSCVSLASLFVLICRSRQR